MTDETRRAVEDIYDAYVRREFERVAARLSEDVAWVIHAPRALFPFAGRRQGRRAVLEALGGIATEYAIEGYAPKHILVDQDRAAVVSDVVFLHRANQRRLNFRIVDLLRIENGMVAEFEEFIDTFDVAEQALGRHLTLS